MSNEGYYTTAEVAKLIGISRISVFRRIKAGKLSAVRFGRNYLIPKDALPIDEIDKAVRLAVKDYGPALKKLAEE